MFKSESHLTRRDFCKLGAGTLGGILMASNVRGERFASLLPYDAYADTIFVNGNIVTMDNANSIVQAIAIKDGLILQTGPTETIQALLGPETQLVDLKNRTLTPGFIDPHNHLQVLGLLQGFYIPLMPPEVRTMDDIRAKLADIISQTAEGEWVQGYFLMVDDRLPNRHDLDPVSPKHPVWIIQQGGHYGTANTLALQMAGITADTQNPVGGLIERDNHGEPTGVFYNHRAMDLMRIHIPQPTTQMGLDNIAYAQPIFASGGVTTFHDNNVRGVDTVGTYFDTDRQGNMLIRGQVYYTLEWPSDVQRALQEIEHYEGNGFMRFAGFKFLLDGQQQMSYCHEPHNGVRWDVPTWEPNTFKNAVRALHDTGLQISVHCSGDATTDLALDAFEEAMNANPRSDPRHRIEHAIITKPHATQRIKDLGVVVCTQPQFIRLGGDTYVDFFGAERARRIIVTREWLEAGVNLALSSDAPTSPWLMPLVTLFGAMTRITYSNQSYEPDQRMTAHEAFYAHTMGGAYAGFEENIKGSIEPGKLADLVVWKNDPFTTLESIANEPLNPATYLPAMQSLQIDMTIVGGKAVFQRDNTHVQKPENKLPSQIHLEQNYPNPFNPSTTIAYSTNKAGHVKLEIMDHLGRKVKTLVHAFQAPAEYQVLWDGTDNGGNQVASGSYFYVLSLDKYVLKRKLIYIK